MADNGKRSTGVMHKMSPAVRQLVGLFALLTTGGISACVGGIASTGVVIALLIGTPVFLFFSPILMPAGIILALCVGGVLAATTAGVAAVSFVTWIYNLLQGSHVGLKRPSFGFGFDGSGSSVGSTSESRESNVKVDDSRRAQLETGDVATVQKVREMGTGQVQSKVQQFESA